jgi:radical SAM protein with 4Fe4S-binding SPASM domain
MGCIVSPYLRPVLQDGRLFLDNAVAGTLHCLTPVQEGLVRALWGPSQDATLDCLVAEYGMEAATQALAELLDCGVLFQSRDACDTWFDERLDEACPKVPFVDQVELTNSCPMRCRFCPRGVPGRMKRATGFMPIELFIRLLDQLHPGQRTYRPLELHHLGESLLHPRVVQFVWEATARGIPTEMSVNPSLLLPPLARGLLDAGLRRIVLSLDGMDDSTLTALRGPVARYAAAEANIRALLDQVAGMPQPPAVVIQMLDLHRNRHQHEAFLAQWATTQLPTVHAYIKALDGPDPDSDQHATRPTRYLCTYPWRSVVVLWDGRVVPCCRDADGEAVLGDLNEQGLEDIWHRAAVSELRAALRQGSVAEGHPCSGCGWRRDYFAAAMQERHPNHATANPLRW